MAAADECLRKVNALLDKAADASIPAERSRLIQEAALWQLKADAAEARTSPFRRRPNGRG